MNKLLEYIKVAIKAVGIGRFLRFAYVALAVLVLACFCALWKVALAAIFISAIVETLVYLDAVDKKGKKEILVCAWNFAADFFGIVAGSAIATILML